MKNKELYGDLFCTMYNIDSNNEVKTAFCNPEELLISERIDLISKIVFINAYKYSKMCTFIKEYYLNVVGLLTSDSFVEYNNSYKNSKEKYINDFIKLYENIVKNGFLDSSIIPVGQNHAILDGAHRLAIAIVNNYKIPIQVFNNVNLVFDASTMFKRGANSQLVDYTVLEYIKRKNNILCFCLWPMSYNQKQRKIVDKLLSESYKIIYKKEVYFNKMGFRNFLIQTYDESKWMGGLENHYISVGHKVDSFYIKNKNCIFYFIENTTKEHLTKTKNKIRNMYGIGTSSCHSTDVHKETLSIANTVLSDTTIKVLNTFSMDYNLELNKKIIQISKNASNINKNILINSNILKDLNSSRYNKELEFTNIDNENSEDELNLFFDPKKHFFYRGLYFVLNDDFMSGVDKKKMNLTNRLKFSFISFNNFVYSLLVKLLIKNKKLYLLALKIKKKIFKK